MFYWLSKLTWFVLAPSHLPIWLALAAAVLIRLKHTKPAFWCISASSALLIGFGVLPLGVWLMHPLENRYSHPVLPAHVDGVLVLGGSLDPDIFASRGAVATEHGGTRILSAFLLARQHPRSRVVFSGGAGPVGGRAEADVARSLFAQLGLPADRLLIENKSRDTWENFVFSKRLAQPKKGETWVLATSAFHLRRSLGIASRVGWQLVPYPTDYMTAANGDYDFRQIPDNLNRADAAIHEWLGLLAYSLSHRSS